MTTRERLHRLVDDLSDDEAAEALALLEGQLADQAEPACRIEKPPRGNAAARSGLVPQLEANWNRKQFAPVGWPARN